ncbi:MAG: lycopene cyclase family protein [Fibrobacterota bacterium]
MKKYDIAVIGAGPAGLTALKHLLQKDSPFSIALIEKESTYKNTIRCGEGVWKSTFDKCYTPQPDWIRQTITRARFIAPNKKSAVFEKNNTPLGYILNREKMQEDLLRQFTAHDQVTLLRGRKVTAVIPTTDTTQKIVLSDSDLEASVVIDASGPLSGLGKYYGITPCTDFYDMGAYAVVEGIENNPAEIQLYRDFHSAHDGYLWSFPVSKTTANVGVAWGDIKNNKINIARTLDSILHTLYPEGRISQFFGGVIPVFTEKRPWAAQGFIQCGDAGSMVNPLFRSGIFEAMLTGGIAGETAADLAAAATHSHRRKICREYNIHIWKRHAKRMAKGLKARKGLYSIKETAFNKAVSSLHTDSDTAPSMKRIIKTVVSTNPTVYFSLRHFL